MKKLLNILITSILVCAMLISCALPVFASSPNLPYEVYDWESYNRAIKRLDSGYDEYISMRVSELQLMDQKGIRESNMTVNFSYSEYYVNYSAIYSGGTHNRFFTIYGDNITINFEEGVRLSTMTRIEGDGACLRIIGNNCTIYNADIRHCSAVNGGAIYVEGDNCVLNHCTFEGCQAIEDGGAVYIAGSNCKVVDCYFYDCSAGENGGAIYTNNDAVIEDCYFRNCSAVENGGAVYTNDDDTVIDNCRFRSCRTGEDGGAVYTNDDAVIENCNFSNCSAGKNGGSIYDNNSVGEVSIKKCSFEEGNCGEAGTWVYGGGDAVVDYCTFSGGDTERYYYDCEKVTNSVGSTEPQPFIRPIASQYAQNAMANNENCDVIRRDENNPVKSDKEYVTLTAKTSDVFGWRAKDDSPLTITAKEGYIITAIEGHVPAYDYNGARDYEYLIADHGKKSIDDKYVDMYGRARGDIDAWIKIGDIYSDSVSLTMQKDIYNRHTMFFDEFIVYFAEDTPENRPAIEDISTDYTRDGETYDKFTFDMNKASYTEPYIATSEQKGFTLTDTVVPARGHIYGWATKITITAPEGYTITRIEGKPVHFEGNVEFLKSNAGTIVNQGKPLAKDGIVCINDINASSVEIDCTTNYVEFGEFLVFYEKNATLASVFSGGTLWLIIGVAAVAVAAAVVILVVVKKKKKPVTVNGAADNE